MLPRLRLPVLAFVPLLKGGSRHMASYWAPARRCLDRLESAEFGRLNATDSLKPADKHPTIGSTRHPIKDVGADKSRRVEFPHHDGIARPVEAPETHLFMHLALGIFLLLRVDVLVAQG